MATLKNASTNVKYTKGGEEFSKDVPYSVSLAETPADRITLATDKLTEDERKADNAAELAEQKVTDYFNQVMETNARQAARAAFLSTVEGPDKQIRAMAKSLAAIKGITAEEAEKQVRAMVG